MELLLWLWLYDARYLANIHPCVLWYTMCWLVSIMVNALCGGFTLYMLVTLDFVVMCDSTTDTLKCFGFSVTHETYVLVVTGIKVVTILCSCIHIIVLKLKHSQHIRKRRLMLFQQNNVSNNEHIDYFVRRSTLYHINGIALLIMSVINFIMSINYIISPDSNYVCNASITKVVKYDMWYEFILGTPVVLVLVVAVVIKVFNFICADTCPSLMVHLSKCASDKKRIKNKKRRAF